jgi:hypothetical protein
LLHRLRLFGWLLLLVLTAAVVGAQAKDIESGASFTEEQLGVYRGFLEKFGTWLHIRNLSKTTLPLSFDGFPPGHPCLAGIDLENPEALKPIHVFGPEISKGRQSELVDPLEQTRLLDDRAASSNESAEQVHGENDLNFLMFSEIAFDRTRKFAVVKYLLVSGKHRDSGATLVMEKIDGKWTASSRRPCALFLN